MAVSGGVAAARRRCCAGGVLTLTENLPMCANWRHNDNWDYPHCGEPKANRPPGVGLPGNGEPLTPAVFEGPPSFCSLSLWASLQAVDVEAHEQLSRQRMLEIERVVTVPRVRQWMGGLPADARIRLLRNLVATAVLSAETAQELAVCEGLPFCP